jgi:hypothetical protein
MAVYSSQIGIGRLLASLEGRYQAVLRAAHTRSTDLGGGSELADSAATAFMGRLAGAGMEGTYRLRAHGNSLDEAPETDQHAVEVLKEYHTATYLVRQYIRSGRYAYLREAEQHHAQALAHTRALQASSAP